LSEYGKHFEKVAKFRFRGGFWTNVVDELLYVRHHNTTSGQFLGLFVYLLFPACFSERFMLFVSIQPFLFASGLVVRHLSAAQRALLRTAR
jgi:hypothetical protein